MLGTYVSVVSASLLALQGSPVAGAVLQGLMTALVPALLMNICIVGLNQLHDVETIDKVCLTQWRDGRTYIVFVFALGSS